MEKDDILAALRKIRLEKADIWNEIVESYEGVKPFALGVSESSLLVDEEKKTFEAHAEALVSVPAYRMISQTRDMAPLTLPVIVRGRYGADGIVSEMTLLATDRMTPNPS